MEVQEGGLQTFL